MSSFWFWYTTSTCFISMKGSLNFALLSVVSVSIWFQYTISSSSVIPCSVASEGKSAKFFSSNFLFVYFEMSQQCGHVWLRFYQCHIVSLLCLVHIFKFRKNVYQIGYVVFLCNKLLSAKVGWYLFISMSIQIHYHCSKKIQGTDRGVTPIWPGWPLANGSEGRRGPWESKCVCERSRSILARGPSLGVTPLGTDKTIFFWDPTHFGVHGKCFKILVIVFTKVSKTIRYSIPVVSI